MKFGRNKSESDDGSTPSTPPRGAGSPPARPPSNREPRESIAPRTPATPRGESTTGSRETRPVAPATTSGPTTPGAATPAPERAAPEKTAPAAAGQSDDHARPHSGLTDKNKVRPTRVSGLWIGVVIAAILAVFLLIFIAQNSNDVTIQFLGWEGVVPLAVAMLAGAVVSVLIVAVPGSLRIAQLRRALRKNAKLEGKSA